MAVAAAFSKMLSMPAADITRRILVPLAGQQFTAAAAPRVRRYKMARMAPVSREEPPSERFSHLRRSYD